MGATPRQGGPNARLSEGLHPHPRHRRTKRLMTLHVSPTCSPRDGRGAQPQEEERNEQAHGAGWWRLRGLRRGQGAIGSGLRQRGDVLTVARG